jgi:hypothetical protein
LIEPRIVLIGLAAAGQGQRLLGRFGVAPFLLQ